MITIPGFPTVNVPDATVTFVPGPGSASTSFAGTWTTTVPSSIKGNTFFSGHSVQIPAGLPGSVKPTWSGTISIDTPGVSVNWQWAAANYPGAHFSANDGALGVKSVDNKTLDPLYQNNDHAGKPENFKQFVVGGGTGGGGSNYTGSYSGTGKFAASTDSGAHFNFSEIKAYLTNGGLRARIVDFMFPRPTESSEELHSFWQNLRSRPRRDIQDRRNDKKTSS